MHVCRAGPNGAPEGLIRILATESEHCPARTLSCNNATRPDMHENPARVKLLQRAPNRKASQCMPSVYSPLPNARAERESGARGHYGMQRARKESDK